MLTARFPSANWKPPFLLYHPARFLLQSFFYPFTKNTWLWLKTKLNDTIMSSPMWSAFWDAIKYFQILTLNTWFFKCILLKCWCGDCIKTDRFWEVWTKPDHTQWPSRSPNSPLGQKCLWCLIPDCSRQEEPWYKSDPSCTAILSPLHCFLKHRLLKSNMVGAWFSALN